MTHSDEDEDHNIGENEADQLPYTRSRPLEQLHYVKVNGVGQPPSSQSEMPVAKEKESNHEAAAIDYFIPAESNSANQKPANNAKLNGRSEAPTTITLTPSSIIKVPPKSYEIPVSQKNGVIKPQHLNLKLKQQKKRERKAAGWTKSDCMEGHVNIEEMNKLLDFVGEDTSSSGTQHGHKKKLSKKTSGQHKAERNGGTAVLVNGTHSTVSDDETGSKESESHAAPSRKQLPVNSGQSWQLQNEFHVLNGSSEQDFNNSDGGFKEVQRRRKVNKGHVEKANSSQYRNVEPKAVGSKVTQRRNGFVKMADGNLAKSKTAVISVLDNHQVDLSLNSFPVLDAQSSATSRKNQQDEEDSSVPEGEKTLPPPAGNSWAKVAATPTAVNGCKQNVPLSPPSDVKDMADKDSTNSSDYSPSDSSAVNKTLPLDVSFSSAIGIEFGTVSNGADRTSHQHIQHILSSSGSDERNLFKSSGQSKGPNPTRVANGLPPKKPSSKNVIVFDTSLKETKDRPLLGKISFGFDYPPLELRGEPVEPCDSKTPSSANITASLSYPRDILQELLASAATSSPQADTPPQQKNVQHLKSMYKEWSKATAEWEKCKQDKSRKVFRYSDLVD